MLSSLRRRRFACCELQPLALLEASYDQEPRAEVQVPYMVHLLGVASLVLGGLSDPDL